MFVLKFSTEDPELTQAAEDGSLEYYLAVADVLDKIAKKLRTGQSAASVFDANGRNLGDYELNNS